MTHLFNNKFKKNNKIKLAFTLIEVLVAISIFIVLILLVSRIYMNILRSQENVSAESYVQSDLEYFMQVASNNLRLAEIGDGVTCSSAVNKFFTLSTSSISYIKDGKCLGFYLDGDAIKINWHASYEDQAITSAKTKVLDLVFETEDDISTGQPIVTFLVKAAPVDEPDNIIYMQTSVSVN